MCMGNGNVCADCRGTWLHVFFSAFLQEREGSGTGVLVLTKLPVTILVEVLSNIYKLAHYLYYLSTS